TTADGKAIPSPVRWGDKLHFEAADATQTLAQAGYDPAMDFTPGSGDYTYNWYVDEVSPENLAATGRTFDYTVGGPRQQLKAGVSQQNIVLEVVNVGGSGQPDRSYTRYVLTVTPPVFLPFVDR
ncbi:MAG: hypothetical protein D6790_04165, partial [Caldilineae bacterium]